ncbi:MAG: AMP-binding protein [Gammaproteobacteria bacterium]|nr:AMP-binding protein [Gammaproteobacteria bacterium]MBI5614964.1 AMP-binding protein [Gammaproteobacteria bacterium]
MQIGTLIRRAARYYADTPCLVEGTRSITFREFDAATDRLGNALLARGLVPGDRVAVALANSIECLVAYYATAKAGLVRVGLNTRETLDNHKYKIADSGSRAVIHAGIEGLEAEILIGPEELTAMIANGERKICNVERALDAPYRFGYTGGTTGKSKAVTLTTRGELAEISAFLTDLVPEIQSGDTFLHAAPIAHASGAFFLPCVARGATSLIMPKFDAAEFLVLAEKTQASMTFLVPTMLAMILEEPGLAGAKLNLRRISYGASPIAPSVLDRAQGRFGKVFAQTYGQAESPMVITCLKPDEHDRIGSCGRPFTIVECCIMDDEDRELPPGEIGEICCRGPQTMAYYWNRPEQTAEAFRNGWLHTGDVGRMDEDGFYYILDRKNDMLISGGFNVYPREVEDVLLACPGVVEAAVVGLPDEKWGDRIHAVVSGQPGLDTEKLLAHARDALANYKRPKSIEIWPDLPKSAANKILRREVRDRIVARDAERK